MNFQPIVDTSITIFVLLGIFLLAYSAVRKQGISDTWEEIKEMIHGKVEDVGSTFVYR